MSATDKLLDWLARGPGDRRDKVSALPQHVATIRVVRWLVDDPGPGRFVQDLTVGIVAFDSNTYEGVANVLAGATRALRKLFLGDFTSTSLDLSMAR